MTQEQFNQTAILVSAQTSLVVFFVFSGVLLMLFAEPPIKWFEGGAPYHGKNWLPAIAAAVLLALFLIIISVSRVRSFFQLVPLSTGFYIAIAIVTLLWILTQRWVYRSNLLEHFLDLERRYVENSPIDLD